VTLAWPAILTVVATSLLAVSLATLIYDAFFRYRMSVRERLRTLEEGLGREHDVALFKDLAQLQSEGLTLSRLKERLQQVIDESGIPCSIAQVATWSACAGLFAGLGGGCRSWWLGAALVPVGASFPFIAVAVRRRARQRKLARQLPEAFAMISRAVRAGQTVTSALQIIADDFEQPISTEFALCYEQQNLGISREVALRNMAARSGIMELQIFVVALLVQAKSGGDLVELLDNLALMIRKRLKLTDRVRALTGEGRMQARVLIILPLAVFCGITYLSPEYAAALMDRPWLLASTAAAQAVGAYWVRSIVNFQY
jgi:tight adherence protein B